jgi:hypothetical protein
VLFDAPGVREKILKIWPFLLPSDELWRALAVPASAPHQFWTGTFAHGAPCPYSPFAQRSLALMGAGELDPEISPT